MTASRRLRSGRKADLLWALVAFLGGQFALIVYADQCFPGLYDREYGCRLDLLRAGRAVSPNGPLLVVLGSSRIGMAVLPERLPLLRSPQGERVVPFNFSHQEAGPLYNLLQTHRLLRQGLRPRWLVVELCPLFWPEEHAGLCSDGATAGDLPVLLGHVPRSKVLWHYLCARLVPAYQHRQAVLQRFAPLLSTEAHWTDRIRLGPLGGDEEWTAQTCIDPVQRDGRRRLLLGKVASMPPRRVSRSFDRATRDLLDLCQRHGIEVVLLITPEDAFFRASYPQPVLQAFESYVAGLSAEYGVAVCDARTWLGDDVFSDGHHTLLPGAEQFTLRLHAAVLEPLVAGRLRPAPDGGWPGAVVSGPVVSGRYGW
jgi:hypothetical protein